MELWVFGVHVSVRARGWDAGEISDLLSNPFVKDYLPGISPEEGEKLVELLREIGLKGLTVDECMK